MITPYDHFRNSAQSPFQKIGDNEFCMVNANHPSSMSLMERAYEGVFMQCFPKEDERDYLEDWVKGLKGQDPKTWPVVLIAGENLNSRTPTIKALSSAYYFPEQDVCQFRQVAVDPQYRGGMGRAMVEGRKKAVLSLANSAGKPLGGIFTECHNPTMIKAQDDVMDPNIRLAMFKNMGAHVMPVDYILPSPLDLNGGPWDCFLLLNYPHPETGKYASKDVVKDYVRALYTNLDPTREPDSSPYFQTMMQRIDDADIPAGGRPTATPRRPK